MKKTIVSVISWLLAVAMLVSMPVGAFANMWDGDETQPKDAPAAQSDTATDEENNETKGENNETKGENIETTGSKNVTTGSNSTDGETKPTDGETKPTEPEWKEDGRSVKALQDVDLYRNWTDKEKYNTWSAGSIFTIHETATINGVTWWKVHTDPYYYVKSCTVNVYAKDPISDTTVAKDSIGTLKEAQVAYASPDSSVSVGSFDKGHSFSIKACQKYEYDIWVMEEIDGDKEAWFKLSYVDVEKPGSGSSTGSTGSTGTTSGLATGVIANTDRVNVRNLPSTEGTKVVARLNRGTEVTIYEKKQSGNGTWWARIGKDEWVCMDYVTVTSGNAGTTEDPEPEETEKPLKIGIVVNCTKLNVRSIPSTSGNLQGRLANGTQVSIYETVTKNGVEWGRIGENKWVSLQYVNITDENPSASDPAEGGDNDTTVDETPIASGTVTSNMNLKVRTGAGTNFPIKTSLVKGSKISIYETKTVNGSQWGRIGKDQWVCLSYVNIDSGSVSDGNTDSASSTANATIVNCSKAVNVRATPSVTGAFVAQISVNTRVYISETKKASNGTKWGKVDNGWVCMDYVKMDDDATVDDGTGTVSTTVGASYANITVPATVGEGGATVWVNAGKDSKEDDYLLVLGKGTEINITGRALANDEQWGKVNINGLTGWVDMKYITLKEISATVSAAQVNAYAGPSTDAEKKVVWGKGQEVTIVAQKTDGTYLWGQDKSTQNWVNMASLAIKPESDGTDETLTATISIIGKVKDKAELKNAKGETLLTLKKDTKVEITDLNNENGVCMGRVTINNVAIKPITGWVNMDDISQTAVSGKVSADSATLYRTLGGQAATLTLKKDNSVTILERTKTAPTETDKGTVYGKLKINNAFYWIKMSNVTLNGTGTPTNTGSTGNVGNTGNIGNTGANAPSGATNVTGVVNYRYLNVRSEASATSKLVKQLKQGDKVTVYEQTTNNGAIWGRIDQGWVAMEYINLSSRPTATGTTVSNTTIMTSVPSGAVAVGFVSYDGLTIRSGAGLGYDKVGSLRKGTNVVITEQKLSGGMIWGKIDKGWICTSYVTMTGASISGSGSTGTIARCAYTVNVRNNPGVGSALVAKLLVNSRVEILDTKIYSGEQWGRTSLGWISMQYVLMDN